MATNRYLIRPHGGAWLLEHNGHVIDRLDTREAALDQARVRVKAEDGEIVMVDGEGMFVDHERYGTRGGGGPVG